MTVQAVVCAPLVKSVAEPDGSKDKDAVSVDADYYFEGKYVTFQAEKSIFRVPIEPLITGSKLFFGRYLLSQGGRNKGTDGASLKNPIMLPNTVKSEDFRSLLRILYPRDGIHKVPLTKLQWISVLKLSTEWSFMALRHAATHELTSQLDPFEMISHGRQLTVAKWVIQGYRELVEREDTITNAEATELEANVNHFVALSLLRIRELLQARQYYSSDSGKKILSQHIISYEIEKEFEEELRTIREKEKGYQVVGEKVLGF